MENIEHSIPEQITNQIIELLETHKAGDYKKEWFDISKEQVFAENPSNHHEYTGINQLYLSLLRQKNHFSLNRWMTFKQIKEAGGKLEKGTKGSPVVYMDRMYINKSTKEDITKDIKDRISKGEVIDKSQLEIETKPYLKHYYVFNVGLTSGLPAKYYDISPKVKRTEFSPDEKAEHILKDLDVQIYHSDHTQAKYNVREDIIYLPSRNLFKDKEGYYSTYFHELGHWTGHESRLNRYSGKTKVNDNKAKEEIIAELFSAFLSARHGFRSQITNNAGYIDSWIKYMKEDSKLIIAASYQAQKAFNYVDKHIKEIEMETETKKVLEKASRSAYRVQKSSIEMER